MSYNTDLQNNNQRLKDINSTINNLPTTKIPQEKIVTPSTEEQVIIPDDETKTLSKVIVEAAQISGAIIDDSKESTTATYSSKKINELSHQKEDKPLVVLVNNNLKDGVFTTDHTSQEAYAAYQAGRTILVRFNNGELESLIPGADSYRFTRRAFGMEHGAGIIQIISGTLAGNQITVETNNQRPLAKNVETEIPTGLPPETQPNVQSVLEQLNQQKVDKSTAGNPEGLATLDSTGKVPAAQLPDNALNLIVTLDSQNIANFSASEILEASKSGKNVLLIDNGKVYHLVENGEGSHMALFRNLDHVITDSGEVIEGIFVELYIGEDKNTTVNSNRISFMPYFARSYHKTFIVPTTSWSTSNTCTLTDAIFKAGNAYDYIISPDPTSAQEYSNASIICTNVNEKNAVFKCKNTPNREIKINVRREGVTG